MFRKRVVIIQSTNLHHQHLHYMLASEDQTMLIPKHLLLRRRRRWKK